MVILDYAQQVPLIAWFVAGSAIAAFLAAILASRALSGLGLFNTYRPLCLLVVGSVWFLTLSLALLLAAVGEV